MNEHTKPEFAKPMTLSERADELEEGRQSGQIFPDGRGSATAEDAG